MTYNEKRSAMVIIYVFALFAVIFVAPTYWLGYLWLPVSVCVFLISCLLVGIGILAFMQLTEHFEEKDGNL